MSGPAEAAVPASLARKDLSALILDIMRSAKSWRNAPSVQSVPIFCVGYPVYGGLNNGTPVSRRSGRRIRHRQTGDPALQFSKALGSTTIAITGSEDNERLAPELGGKRSGHSQRSCWPFAHEARRRGYHSFPQTADPPYLRTCRDSAPMVVWLSWTWLTRPSPYQPRLIGDAPPIGSIQNDRNTLYEALALVAIRNLTDQSGGMGAHEPRFPPLGFRRTLHEYVFETLHAVSR